MARTGGFLSGPSTHNTQRIRKHKLKRGVTRDMNAAAGVPVNTKNHYGWEAARHYAAPKAVGPRYGKTANPKRATFGKKTPPKLLSRRRRR